MATLLLNKAIPLAYAVEEQVFILLAIREAKGYDKEGNPTGETVGYTLSCVEMTNFKTIKVKVPLIKLSLTPEELKEKTLNQERVFIELKDGIVKPYFNSKSKTVEDSISASGFSIVEGSL